VPPLSISRIRSLLRSLHYVVSLHAAEEMQDDGFTILDLENIILTGTIAQRQKDQKTDETKIVIRGVALDCRQAEAVVKVGLSGILYIITVYAT
jgi:hypothetical protein